MGFFDKLFGSKEKEQLEKGLEKTKQGFFSKLAMAIAGKSSIDNEVLDQLEEALISADVGVDTTLHIIEKIQQRVSKEKYMGVAELNELLQQEMQSILVDEQLSKSEFQKAKKSFPDQQDFDKNSTKRGERNYRNYQ
jgi:fused signal recognition particle receptor